MSDEKLAKLEAIGPLVNKVAGAFLDGRWSSPRRYVTLTPYCFMLTDPAVQTLDVARIERMAAELQTRLFGSSDTGEVTLLLHSGDEEATARFVTMDQAVLRKAVKDPSQALPFGGQLMVSNASEDSDLGWEPIDLRARARSSGPEASPSAHYHGVYSRISQSFVGSGITATLPSGHDFSLFGGADQLPGERSLDFDMSCIAAAALRMRTTPLDGALFIPVSFASVMRSATREAYEQGLQTLPGDRRYQLVAVVYDVPRLPARHTFVHLHDLLDPHFSQLDLQISDPGFDLDQVPAGAVNTVTLRLPDGGETVRSSAIRRFLEKRPTFKRQNIGAALTNVRTKAELAACLRPPISYISGRGVCAPSLQPMGAVACPDSHLPWVGSL